MKNKATKRIAALVMALAMVITTVCVGTTSVEAATKVVYQSQALEDATAGTEVKIPFTISKNKQVNVVIVAAKQVAAELAVYDSTGELVDMDKNPVAIAATDWEYASNYDAYGYVDTLTGFSAGDYTYGITFEEDNQFGVVVSVETETAKISQTSATVTKGFTQKLSVSGGKVKSWKSTNTKIAKVDKNGKVTGVKAGKATVYAVTTDGQKLTCKVTVKENKYSDTKITTSDVTYGERALSAYSASFDKSGNLVISAVFVNNTSYRVSYLQNVKITVKDANGKTIGVYSAKKISSSTNAYAAKNMKFTIKKASLKKKTADLRNAKITTSGTAVYYY